MVGAWEIADVQACSLPERLATGFSKTFENIAGASYIPVLFCGTQLVNGTNYIIICEQTSATKEPVKHIVKVILNYSASNKEWSVVTIDNIC